MKAETIETDVLIVGGGAAGCAAAMRAREGGARVLVVVKGKMGRSGATPLASCLGAPSPIPGPYPLLKAMKKLYAGVSDVVRLPVPATYADAMRAMLQIHCWLVDQDYFLDFALWADKEFFPALERAGTYVLRDEAGRPEVPPGNNPYFVLQSHGMTGYLFGESKRKEVLARDIPVMEEATVFSLLRGAGGEVAGALVLDYRRGRLYEVVAKTTILATGHTNWLSTCATGTREMAANGLAMALGAGAELQNLEIQWYHASDMAYPESWMRLHNYPNPLTGTPHQAVMVNEAGEPYMTIGDHDVIMPYTVQVKELYKQVRAGKARWDGGNFTDFRLVEPEVLKTYQYHWEFYEKIGKDMGKDPLESAPTWHMSAGGVRADLSTMRTQVPRLYIAGAIGGHMLGGLPLATFDGEVAGAAAAREALRRGPPKPVAGQAGAGEARLAGLLSEPARAQRARHRPHPDQEAHPRGGVGPYDVREIRPRPRGGPRRLRRDRGGGGAEHAPAHHRGALQHRPRGRPRRPGHARCLSRGGPRLPRAGGEPRPPLPRRLPLHRQRQLAQADRGAARGGRGAHALRARAAEVPAAPARQDRLFGRPAGVMGDCA